MKPPPGPPTGPREEAGEAASPEPPQPDPTLLLDLARLPMPFGRYRGRRLIDLPEPYVVWFHERGLPRGRLGELLGLLYEIKANGLEHLVRPLAPREDGRRGGGGR